MITLNKLLIYGLASLIVIVLLGYFGIYSLSELKLRNIEQPTPFDYPIPTDQESLEYGQHIARTRGCFGCHGQLLQGKTFTDQWDWVERAIAPNLAEIAKQDSPAQLEAAIRHGIGSDGRAFFSMPSYNWVHLSDEEVASLIAYLQSAPVTANSLPKPKLGISARWNLITGADTHMATIASRVPTLHLDELADPSLQRGERLAMTTCSECHGLDLRGALDRDLNTPDLAIIVNYSAEEFRILMKDCVALGGRSDLGLMSLVCPDRFPFLTEEEVTDLYLFLGTLLEMPKSEDVPWRHD